MVGTLYVYGNENLTAEKSHNFNLGAEYTAGQYNFTLSANYNIVNDKIATHLPQADVERQRTYIQYINIKRMNVFALEATAQTHWQLSDASIIGARLGYCFTHEQVRDGSANQYAPARPHSAIIRADWSKAWSKNYSTTLLITGRYLSPLTYTKMQMAPPFSLYDVDCSGYSLWKVQLTNRIRKAFSLNVALDNIFNYAPKHYFFNSPTTLGINLMVGVSVDIDKL
jgi:outer membrane receptor for ferrienterochelin and colicins